MSDNPFAPPAGEADNPYAPPGGEADIDTGGNPLLVPALILLVVSVISLMAVLASMPRQVASMREVDTSTPEGQGHLAGQVTAVVVLFVAPLAVFLGSISMLRLKAFGSARAAAVIASIPFCSPCFVLGIPFGIWAYVLLRKPEIRSLFR